MLNGEDTVQNIFNNVKVSRDKICDYLNEPNEDSKGENILQYIVEQRPREVLDFLNSELVKQVANVDNCIFQQFTFLNDEKKMVFNIALTNNTSFANLLKSNVFQLSLPEEKKYNVFVDQTKRVTVLDDIINLAHTNKGLLGIFSMIARYPA